MLSFVIPTHNRQEELAVTLERLGTLEIDSVGRDAEVIVADNASDRPAETPTRLANGLAVERIRLERNLGTAARNHAARAASGEWLVMLDDDSSPLRCELKRVLEAVPRDVAAVGGEIVLPTGDREAGGLPEVIVGCGAAVRRERFLDVGGYDESFGYYAEEYDLCAKLIDEGHRILHTAELRFEHRKSKTNRDFGLILGRLVRNNGWVIQRHAPERVREQEVESMLERYRGIAAKEGVEIAFGPAEAELRSTLGEQPRTPLTEHGWRRFVGLGAVDRHLVPSLDENRRSGVKTVEPGKGADQIHGWLTEHGITLHENGVELIARLSPGPLLDAADRRPSAIVPWRPSGSPTRTRPCAA